MPTHRIDFAVHDGLLAVINLRLGRSLEKAEAAILYQDTVARLDRLAGRPTAILLDLRALFEVEDEALAVLNDLQSRARRFAHLVDICHVLRSSAALEAITQAQLKEGLRPSPIFATCAEALGYLCGDEAESERSVA